MAKAGSGFQNFLNDLQTGESSGGTGLAGKIGQLLQGGGLDQWGQAKGLLQNKFQKPLISGNFDQQGALRREKRPLSYWTANRIQMTPEQMQAMKKRHPKFGQTQPMQQQQNTNPIYKSPYEEQM